MTDCILLYCLHNKDQSCVVVICHECHIIASLHITAELAYSK